MATQRGLIIGLIVFVAIMLAYLMGRTPPATASKEVPDFPLPLAAPAHPTKMSELHGKVVILDFWATWCGPCQMSMPGLETLYKKYKDRGLVVIGISEDVQGSQHNVEMSKRNLGITYPTAMAVDMEGIETTFPHQGIPALYIIDKQGKLIDSEEGYAPEMMEKLDHTIADALAQ